MQADLFHFLISLHFNLLRSLRRKDVHEFEAHFLQDMQGLVIMVMVAMEAKIPQDDLTELARQFSRKGGFIVAFLI